VVVLIVFNYKQIYLGERRFHRKPAKRRTQASTSFCFISGKNQRIITEISGSTQPIANHFQNDLPRLRAKNAEVNGTKKRMAPRNARIGMGQNYGLRDYQLLVVRGFHWCFTKVYLRAMEMGVPCGKIVESFFGKKVKVSLLRCFGRRFR
jgi:hypothetical protein